jgi:hypothetical protein
MAWEISWLGGTREQLRVLARECFPKLPISQDIGQFAVQKVEEEIRLHPQPSPDLPQVSGEQVFRFGPIEVTYHIDSLAGNAEIRKVTGL